MCFNWIESNKLELQFFIGSNLSCGYNTAFHSNAYRIMYIAIPFAS